MTLPHISFLGIGLMGTPMVSRLLAAGFPMTIWNRSRDKAQPFQERARVADSPADAVADADVIITMLENGSVVDQVLYHSGAIAGLRQGALVVDMSSVEPGTARRHAARTNCLFRRFSLSDPGSSKYSKIWFF